MTFRSLSLVLLSAVALSSMPLQAVEKDNAKKVAKRSLLATAGVGVASLGMGLVNGGQSFEVNDWKKIGLSLLMQGSGITLAYIGAKLAHDNIEKIVTQEDSE